MNTKSLKKELTAITSKLISKETVYPDGNEYLISEYVSGIMKMAGFSVKLESKTSKRLNIIGTYGKGSKNLAIVCHMDTVPAGKGWKTNPFKANIKNGKIYGRGAIDDKGPFAISFCAAKEFINRYPDFEGKVIIIAVADEEADNIYGIKYLISKGYKFDSALVPDGGYFSKLDVGEKGCIQFRITSTGKQAHSALQENKAGALTNLISVINTVRSIKWPTKFDKNFSGVETNVSMLHSGEFPNAIPGSAYAQFDIRFPLGISSGYIIGRINKILVESSGKFELEVNYVTNPHLVNNKTLINSFLVAAKKCGIKIDPVTISGNSVAKELNEAGTPSIVHYPMDKITAHEPNEYIDISQMVKTQKIYVKFLKQYFKVV